MANHPVPNAHRVLRIDGTISPDFRWGVEGRSDDPQVLLEAEGVRFDEHRRADPAQRFGLTELAELCGLDVSAPELTTQVKNKPLRTRFLDQVADHQSADTLHGVIEFLTAWESSGGTLQWGTNEETSCFVMARQGPDSIWPMAIYPSGKVEIVFQHLATREPFDRIELRDEFRQRLNEVPEIDLPYAKLALRPGFDLDLLGEPRSRETITRHSLWFLEQAASSST